jgi:hypothetical protein
MVRNNNIRERFSDECVYCGRKVGHIDHIVPVARGGDESPDNKMPICPKCNLHKNAKPPIKFIKEVLKANSFKFVWNEIEPVIKPIAIINEFDYINTEFNFECMASYKLRVYNREGDIRVAIHRRKKVHNTYIWRLLIDSTLLALRAFMRMPDKEFANIVDSLNSLKVSR